MDWSQPVSKKSEDNFQLKWSDEEDSDSDSDASEGGITMKNSMEEKSPIETQKPRQNLEQEPGGLDIMAQQLKFIACLKILMAEMATLATGFEVDGGQLRLQLYLWLDRELQVNNHCDSFRFLIINNFFVLGVATNLQLRTCPSSWK